MLSRMPGSSSTTRTVRLDVRECSSTMAVEDTPVPSSGGGAPAPRSVLPAEGPSARVADAGARDVDRILVTVLTTSLRGRCARRAPCVPALRRAPQLPEGSPPRDPHPEHLVGRAALFYPAIQRRMEVELVHRDVDPVPGSPGECVRPLEPRVL